MKSRIRIAARDLAHLLPLVGLMSVLGVALQAQRPVDLVDRQFGAQVVSVIDGDTVDVRLPDGRRQRVRLHGVDSPERGEPYSAQARTFMRVLLFSRDVLVTGTDVDVYGRLVARIAVDGDDASEAILSSGLACTYRRYASDPALDAAANRARTARLGFWAPGSPQPACVAREAAATRAPARAPSGRGFVGNVDSRVYHAPTCHNAGCRNCTRKFATRAEAEKAGFRPAGDCLAR